MTVCRLFGDDTAKQVHFITFGYGNHLIRMLNIRLLKHLIACSVSYNSHNVVGVGDVADDNTVCVNDRHKVVHMSLRELAGALQYSLLVCAVERNGEVYIPDGNFVIQAKDSLSIITTPQNAATYGQFSMFPAL